MAYENQRRAWRASRNIAARMRHRQTWRCARRWRSAAHQNGVGAERILRRWRHQRASPARIGSAHLFARVCAARRRRQRAARALNAKRKKMKARKMKINNRG
jgi:hypothetical protein